jgi:CubicO group peptidase (beta-lactamase class C family)
MKLIAISVLLVLVVTGCKPDSNTSEPLEDTLNHYFNSIFHKDEPGASILILKEDKILFKKSYGLADLKTKEPITSKTLFNLGSISKTFVAYGILILRDEGKLMLSDPIGKYFTNFKNQEIASKVTLRHLLTHSSGLPHST